MKRVLLDTGVWIRGLGHRDDDESEACQRVLHGLLDDGVSMLLSAPCLAEMTRGRGGPIGAVPFELVPFNRRAALVCGATFKEWWLLDTSRYLGLREHYIKYDAMIVSCALAGKADAVVALDGGVHALCEHAGLPCHLPDELYPDPGSFWRSLGG